jgi:uncharacterized secreted protein with C-terminal beta-propeller domain
MALSATVKSVIAFGIIMALVIPGLYLIPRGHDVPAPARPYVPPADQPSQPLADQAAWEAYSGQAGNWQEPLNRSLFTRNVTLEELKVLAGAEAEKALNGSAARPPATPSANGTETAAGAYDTNQKGAGTTVTREVEEADIIKLQGSYLYVLNPYRGLIIVDLNDRDHPFVTGAARLQGYPQDMYVVGNLSFVILTATYGYWYNYYTLAAGRGSEVIGGVEVSLGTHIAVVNLKDKAAPKVVMQIPLPGFATDSRRVGDVIYAVTNSYAWTLYGSDNGGSYVTSVDFSEPAAVRRAGTLFFNGTSNQVHASSTAFFLAQPQYDYSAERGVSTYSTKVTYIDISDPHGAIAARDTFTVAGTLSDKYQMDQYGNTFRVVTHFWGFGGQLGSSTLTIYNVANPDSITKLGALDINDAGTLMATRFAGDRAYTIHLPQSIDPLDVLDLSDPAHPRLTDQLEMSGWVTHLEVRGTMLIALGVDNSDGNTNVAVSLFDVSNPANAVMKARVRIGSGYTWSAANWEPKALTVVDEQNLVIVPFSSTSADRYWGAPDNGIQLVEFDLAKGTLAAKGAIANSQPVSRTRAYGDRILATSDYALQVVNAQDRSNPKVVANIQFVWNIQDALPVGNVEVQLYSEGWEGATGLRIVKPGASDWDRPVSELPLNLTQVSLFPEGKTLQVLGINRAEVRLFTYDLSDPASPRLLGTVTKQMPESYYPGGSGAPEKGGADVMPVYIYYSLRTVRLDNGVLAVMPDTYSGETSKKILLFDISGSQPKALSDLDVALPSPGYGGYAYINNFIGSGTTLYLTYWGTDSYFLRRVSLEDPANPVQLPDVNIKGELAGAEPDGSAVYTTSYVYGYDGVSSMSSYGFNKYALDGKGASLAWSVQFDNQSITSARVSGGKAFLTLASGLYYYGYGYAVAPGAGIGYGLEGDTKGGAPSVTLPRTDLVVLDLAASGPAVAGSLGMDGYASILDVSGGTVFVNGEGVLAAYNFAGGDLHFAGGLALRGYVDHIRAFDGGALISEGLYGTETLLY